MSALHPEFREDDGRRAGRRRGCDACRRAAITIRDLLTHTAGISYGTDAQVAALYEAKGLGPAAGYGWYTADKDEPVCDTMERLGTLPFVAQPGEAWVYGYNTDILGCVVETRVGHAARRVHPRRASPTPLGMKDTHFFLPPDERTGWRPSMPAGPTARSRARPKAAGAGRTTSTGRAGASPAAPGSLSTARDYARFLEMIRNGGAHRRRRASSSPRTVR